MGAYLFGKIELLRPLADGQNAAHATQELGTELVVVDPVTDVAEARARTLLDIAHPNLAAVRDVQPQSVISEFVDGERFDGLGEVPLEIVLRVVIDVLAAIGAMHSFEIVHGNVGAANVIIGADGITRLVRGWRGETDDAQADIRGVGEILAAALEKSGADWAEPLGLVADRARANGFPNASEMATAIRYVARSRVAMSSDIAKVVAERAGEKIEARAKELGVPVDRRPPSIAPLSRGSAKPTVLEPHTLPPSEEQQLQVAELLGALRHKAPSIEKPKLELVLTDPPKSRTVTPTDREVPEEWKVKLEPRAPSRNMPAFVPLSLDAGKTIGGKFRLEKRIATNGTNEIWAARHTALGEPVAVKIVCSDADDARVKFDAQAKLLARLCRKSRNVVSIMDQSEEDGVPFLVMELLAGETLDRLIEREPLPLPTANSIVKQLGKVLSVAHAEGVVHGNLAAKDVFVGRDEDGRPLVKLLGFGLVRIPSARNLVPATDIHALATIARAMIPKGPKGFDAILARALEPTADNAYTSVAALADAIDHALGRVAPPAVARPAPPPPAAPPRSRTWLVPAAVVALALLAVAAVGWKTHDSAPAPPAQPPSVVVIEKRENPRPQATHVSIAPLVTMEHAPVPVVLPTAPRTTPSAAPSASTQPKPPTDKSEIF